MTQTATTTIAARFLDAGEEPTQTLLPIKGYETEPLLSLEQAVQPIQSLLKNLDTMVLIAKRNSRNPSDGLTPDESAAIHLYTMQWDEPDISLCTLLNRTLRAIRRESLKPWFRYMKLFFTALYKLPSIKSNIWRGIRGNVSDQYHDDHVWWGVSSCTLTVDMVEQFIGTTGSRTLFMIECINGKSIRAHSYYQVEDEIILLPGSYFRVMGQFNPSKDLHIIHLRETKPTWEIISPPFGFPSVAAHNTHSWFAQALLPQNSSGAYANLGTTQNVGTLALSNEQSHEFNNVHNPYAARVDDDQNVYIADWDNNCILKWRYGTKSGYTMIGGRTTQENRANRLNGPTDVIIDKDRNSLIISDKGNRRVVRWPLQSVNANVETIISNVDCDKLALDNNGYLYISCFSECAVKRWRPGEIYGTVVAGGNGKGDRLNQLNGPDHLYVDRHNSIYVADINNNRVIKWMEGAKEGVIVAGGQGRGKNLNQLCFPQGVVVDQVGTIYVADTYNHRIVKWSEGSTHGRIVVGGKNHEGSTIQLNSPKILSFDRHGYLYIVDNKNSRLQRFDIASSL